jgi:ribosomal protein S4
MWGIRLPRCPARQAPDRGKTRTEAIRLLRRRLSNVLFRAMLVDERAAAERTGNIVEDRLPQVA